MEIVRQQWKELGHFGNPRSNETLYNNFQIRFSTKKVSLAYFCAYHIGYEQRGAK